MSCGLALFFTIIVTMIDRVALHPEREEAAAGSSVVIYGTGRDSGQDAGMATGSGRPAGSGGTDAPWRQRCCLYRWKQGRERDKSGR